MTPLSWVFPVIGGQLRAASRISLALALLITIFVAGSAAAAASLPDIEDEVMCPICGTTLELSEAPQAQRERAFIRRLIAEGQTKDEIKDALVAEYGPEVLAVPDTEGFDLVAWVLPGAGLLLAGAGIAFGVRRWREGGRPEDGPAAPASADTDRLDEDLARYDL